MVIAVVIIFSLSFYLAWIYTVNQEHKQLQQYARWMLKRAEQSFSNAEKVLNHLIENNKRYTPCSKKHINYLRQQTVNCPIATEIGYFEDGELRCTSWGKNNYKILATSASFALNKHTYVSIIDPTVIVGGYKIAVQKRNYNILLDPLRFTDFLMDNQIRLAVLSANGYLLGTLGHPNIVLIKNILLYPKSLWMQDNLFAIVKNQGLISIALEPKGKVAAKLANVEAVLLPFALLGSLLATGFIALLSQRRLSPLTALKKAIQNKQFIVYYQPIIEAKGLTCVGAEALVRWRQTDGQIINPEVFISLAENNGLVAAITKQVLDEIVNDLEDWLLEDKNRHISINLSAIDIQNGKALTLIQEKFSSTGINPQQIWLEATEHSFVNFPLTKKNLRNIQSQGYQIAIDDFGTGYSSLSYLQNFTVDILKIDKTFIDAINKDCNFVIDHIIDLAKTLNIKIVAEGIESMPQLAFLQKHQIDYAQGFLFAKPLAVKDFIAYVRTRHSYAIDKGFDNHNVYK